MHAPISAVRTLAGLLCAGLVFATSAPASADGVEMLRGKPTSAQIIEALRAPRDDSPRPAMRTRGLSLGPAAAAESAPAPSVEAPSAPSAPAAPSVRALDLQIQFAFNSDRLTSEGREVLDQLGAALLSDELAGARSIILEGHTDAKGSDAYNRILSLRRASAVEHYLIETRGVPAAKLHAVGKGASELADPAHPEDGVNRRVRIIVEG